MIIMMIIIMAIGNKTSLEYIMTWRKLREALRIFICKHTRGVHFGMDNQAFFFSDSFSSECLLYGCSYHCFVAYYLKRVIMILFVSLFFSFFHIHSSAFSQVVRTDSSERINILTTWTSIFSTDSNTKLFIYLM